jgi:hypothetical protein
MRSFKRGDVSIDRLAQRRRRHRAPPIAPAIAIHIAKTTAPRRRRPRVAPLTAQRAHRGRPSRA